MRRKTTELARNAAKSKKPRMNSCPLGDRRQEAFPAQQVKIGDHKTGRHGSEHARHMEILGDQERAISGNHGEGGLDQVFRTPPGDDECGTSAYDPNRYASRDDEHNRPDHFDACLRVFSGL